MKGGDPTQILHGGNNANKNTLDSLLNRAIKFRKSRYVDEKLENFKRKFAPVNFTDRKNQPTHSAATNESTTDLIDENGFEKPSKVLFSRDQLHSAWSSIRPVGTGLSSDLSSLNAVLQVLSYTPALANYFLARYHGNKCLVEDFCFACALEDHVCRCLKPGSDVISPRFFVGKVKKIQAQAREPIAIYDFFMEEIQRSLLLEKRVEDKTVQKTTALYQIFGGYLQNVFTCSDCKTTSNSFNSFLRLSLDITAGNTVEKCLTGALREQTVDKYTCPSCEKQVRGNQKNSLYRAPMALTLQLSRFNDKGDKNGKMVKFTETLDIRRWIPESEIKEHPETIYHLYGVIVHQGASSLGGQYVAYIKAPNGIWHCMNNDVVQQSSAKRVLEQQAYILLYTLQSSKKASAQNPTVKKGLKALEPEPLLASSTEDTSKDDEEEREDSDQEEEVAAEVSEKDEERERLRQAQAKAKSVPLANSNQAVVVAHSESMESKRSKLDELVRREMAYSTSAAAKEALLSKAQNSQFSEEVAGWDDEDVGDAVVDQEREKLLKKMKNKRKKVDTYDLEYDRGKVKKVKKKNMDKFKKPNEFQKVAETMQRQKR